MADGDTVVIFRRRANISQYELNDAETKVLTKGLNYAIAPKQIPVEEYIVATEQACSMLPQTEAESLRADMKGILKSPKLPKFTINKEEGNTLKSLCKNETIILPADNGRATEVMDKSQYEKKVCEMLDDKKTLHIEVGSSG